MAPAAETIEADRRRQTVAAAEKERTRWARELHDETLQSLASLRIGLAAQLRRASPVRWPMPSQRRSRSSTSISATSAR
jgi:signal transduction histidine kinase